MPHGSLRRRLPTRRLAVTNPDDPIEFSPGAFIEVVSDECEPCSKILSWGEQRYLNDDGDSVCLDTEACEARVAAGGTIGHPVDPVYEITTVTPHRPGHGRPRQHEAAGSNSASSVG
jgi:hypothetical protein